MERRTVLRAISLAPIVPYLSKGKPQVLTTAELEQALYAHGRDFHGAAVTATSQIKELRWVLEQAQANGITDKRAAVLVPRFQTLLSALHYKEGDYSSAGSWAEIAINSAAQYNDRQAMAYAYIRKIQNECWNGIPQRAAYYAEHAMKACWGYLTNMEALWLASHVMRAYAMYGDKVGYNNARAAGAERAKKVPMTPKMTAFTFGANQWPQAVAIAETYMDPHNSLSWYNTALEMNPRDAYHVNTLDMLHRSMALIRCGDKEGGLDYAAWTLQQRKKVGPLEPIYKDRAGKVLAQLPHGYQTKRVEKIREIVST